MNYLHVKIKKDIPRDHRLWRKVQSSHVDLLLSGRAFGVSSRKLLPNGKFELILDNPINPNDIIYVPEELVEAVNA